MREVIAIVTIILSIIIVALILLQGKGAGLGSAWGGSGEVYQTRRGVEKLTMQFTILSITVFLLVSLISLFIG